MTIILRKYDRNEAAVSSGTPKLPPVFEIRIRGEKSIANFEKLLQRALNTWDDAPAELKELADLYTHDKVLQNYAHQESQQ